VHAERGAEHVDAAHGLLEEHVQERIACAPVLLCFHERGQVRGLEAEQRVIARQELAGDLLGLSGARARKHAAASGQAPEARLPWIGPDAQIAALLAQLIEERARLRIKAQRTCRREQADVVVRQDSIRGIGLLRGVGADGEQQHANNREGRAKPVARHGHPRL
jgi:hypothetical protein